LKRKTIVITGGSGVIGSHLAEYLINLGHEVIVIDNLFSGSTDNLPDSNRLHFYKKDVRDKSIADIYNRYYPNILFHLAARYANELSIKDPFADLSVNAGGTLIQLELALNTGIDRFVYGSSSCVYLSSEKPVKENYPLHPHTPYGISKLAGEYYCQFYSYNYGLKTTILRYFNSYGPKESTNIYRGVVPRFINNALNNSPIVITGTGNEKRDFTYVEDTVKGTILAGFAKEGENQTFNIGTGQATTISELAKTICTVTSSSSPVQYSMLRSWDQTITRIASIEKIQRLLNFKPVHSLYDGLALTTNWYKKSKNN